MSEIQEIRTCLGCSSTEMALYFDLSDDAYALWEAGRDINLTPDRLRKFVILRNRIFDQGIFLPPREILTSRRRCNGVPCTCSSS